MELTLLRLVLSDVKSSILSKRRGLTMLIAMTMVIAVNPVKMLSQASASLQQLAAFTLGTTISSLVGLTYALAIVEERGEGRIEFLIANSPLSLTEIMIVKALGAMTMSTAFTLAVEVVSSVIAGKSVSYVLIGLTSVPIAALVASLGFVIPKELSRVYPAIVAITMLLALRQAYQALIHSNTLIAIAVATLIATTITIATVPGVKRLYELALT